MNRGRVLEALGLAAVLGLAAWLRLGWPDYYNFGYDEARASLLALQMARSGVFISTGMVSSTGLPNMPGFIWLLSPLFALSSDPLLATCCIAGVNVLAVAGLWRLVRRAWGPLAAFVAALLLASSPWAVFYSRGIWGQDLLIPTAILWMLLLERACRPPSERIRRGRALNWLRLRAPDIAMAAAVLTAGFAPQVHYAGLALLPATVAAFFMLRLHRRWKGALAGILVAGLSALPFVLALLRDSGLHQAISALLRQAPVSDLAALADLKRLALGQGWEELLLSSEWVWSQPLQRWLGVCRVITAILAVLGMIAMIRLACRRDALSSRLARLGLALLVVPPLLFIRHSTEVYVQYMLPALPGAFLAVGALAAGDARISGDVPRRRRVVHQALSVGTAALVLLTAAGQAAALSQGIRMAGEQALPDGLGTPLGYPRRAARMLQQQTTASGAEIIVYSPGDDPAYIADAAIYEVLLWDSPHRIADGNAVLLLPAAWQARMLAVFPDLPVMAQARADGLVGDEQELPRRAGEPAYLAWTAVSEPQGYMPAQSEVLANGAQLLGWKMARLDSGLRLSVMWRLTNAAEGTAYHQFNHLYGADGQTRLEVQDRALSSGAWRAGDTLITWADFALPEGQAQVYFDIGMYSYPSLERVSVLGAADPAAAIRLGPIAVP